MKNYELLYILDATLADDAREALIEKITAMVTSNGGEAQDPERWGVKKYAYAINFQNEGYYVLMNFKANASVPEMLASQLLITDGVVRHMIVAK